MVFWFGVYFKQICFDFFNLLISITDHTGKEDEFFDIIEEKSSLSEQENEMLIKHFENCRNQIGGAIRIEQMVKLIEYLEDGEWMK